MNLKPYDYKNLISSKTNNIALVTTIMRNSHAGVIAHAFVIDAIYKIAERIIEDPESIRTKMQENGSGFFIDPNLWIQAALDVKAAIDLRDGRQQEPEPDKDNGN